MRSIKAKKMSRGGAEIIFPFVLFPLMGRTIFLLSLSLFIKLLLYLLFPCLDYDWLCNHWSGGWIIDTLFITQLFQEHITHIINSVRYTFCIQLLYLFIYATVYLGVFVNLYWLDLSKYHYYYSTYSARSVGNELQVKDALCFNIIHLWMLLSSLLWTLAVSS